MPQYVTNCYFLPPYNRKIYRAKIKKKIFDWHFLKTRKTYKSFRGSRKSQLLLYLEKKKIFGCVYYRTQPHKRDFFNFDFNIL